jgi:hypothetical protein
VKGIRNHRAELKSHIHDIMATLDGDIREISYHRLRSILRKTFGVRCSLEDIRLIFRDRILLLSLGWGRGKDYLRRIPDDFKWIENKLSSVQ